MNVPSSDEATATAQEMQANEIAIHRSNSASSELTVSIVDEAVLHTDEHIDDGRLKNVLSKS